MKTIEYWNKQKRHLMRALRYAHAVKSKKGIEMYSNAVNRCDVKIGVISAMQRALGVIILLACLFAASGCNIARETMHLGGAACQDVSWLLEKGAENIQVEKGK